MSSQFSEKWEANPQLDAHREPVGEVLGVVTSELDVPKDQRFEIGTLAMLVGGKELATYAEGPFGTGKSQLANIVAGSRNMVTLQQEDTATSLMGHKNPTDSTDFVGGKFEALEPENPIFVINELPHLRDTKPVSALFEEELRLDGDLVDNGNGVFYMTGNYPNTTDQNYPLRGSLRDRLGIKIDTGDATDEVRKKIYMREPTSSTASVVHEGMTPNAAARRALREALATELPIDHDGFAEYAMEVAGDISGAVIDGEKVFRQLGPLSSRKVSSWKQAARVGRFVFDERGTDGNRIKSPIGEYDAYAVASLVLPTVIDLSYVGKDMIAELSGNTEHDPHLESLAIRSLIEEICFRNMIKAMQAAPTNPQIKMESLARTLEGRDMYRERFSYATANGASDAIAALVERTLGDEPKVVTTVSDVAPKRKLFKRR